MTAAYEAALLDLRLADRDDPITEIVASAIVSVTSMGELDPAIIKDRALNTIGSRSFNSKVACRFFRTFDQATASVCGTCG